MSFIKSWNNQEIVDASRHRVSEAEAPEVERNYTQGMNLLRKGKPRKALPLIEKVLELNPAHQGAKIAKLDIEEASRWSGSYWCKRCGALLTPQNEYGWGEMRASDYKRLDIEFPDFCPQCHRRQAGLHLKLWFPYAFEAVIAVAIGYALPIGGYLYAFFVNLDRWFSEGMQMFRYPITFYLLGSPNTVLEGIILFAIIYLCLYICYTPVITVYPRGWWKY